MSPKRPRESAAGASLFAAAGVGFQKGDIIVAVNNQKVAKTSDLEKATSQTARVWRITLVRGGQQINVQLGG